MKIFEAFPNIDNEYFKLGFDGKETYKNVYANRTLEFPDCYNIGTHVKAITAPKYRTLLIGKSYEFEFYIPRGLSVATIDAQNNWTYFDGNGGVFKLNYIPATEGELKVSAKYDKGGKSYWAIISYLVKGKNTIS
ncbi:MAG: hypothetical protein H6581_22925 [Bacteroidia bacterium]|nr:hypothetical protein [Bacteroidia bacterium]